MFDQFVQYLNKFSAGEVAIALAVIAWAIYSSIQAICAFLEKHKQFVQEDLKKNEEWISFKETLNKVVTDLDTLNEKVETDTRKIAEEISSHKHISDDADGTIQRAITNLNESIDEQIKSIRKINERLKTIESQVNLLMESDAAHIRAFIVDAFNRYAQEEKQIDLLTLQNLERVFNKYMEEMGPAGDDFIVKLMQDLRNLPTVKENG